MILVNAVLFLYIIKLCKSTLINVLKILFVLLKQKRIYKKLSTKLTNCEKKYFLLGYITYDFKKLYFEVFDKYKKYTPAKSKQLGTIIRPKITKEQYINAIEKIKQYISEGVTYEVNYTYPSEVLTNLDGIELFEALLDKQKTPYNTFIKNKYTTLLSFSPELFFRLEGRKITTKPMKGTAPKLDDGKDEERRDFLYNDIKKSRRKYHDCRSFKK